MVEAVSTHIANVERAQSGWSIYVPDVDRHTWAPNLREVTDMARDLVQVMTDQPLEDIEVEIVLPKDLSTPIQHLQETQAAAASADATAREAQRVAVSTLREADAPLRDIAEALGISYQRVHQILADVARRQEQLDHFRTDVDTLLDGIDYPLVTADDGTFPVVVALGDELLTTLTKRVQAAGGQANVFVRSLNGAIRYVAVIHDECAIVSATDDLSGPKDRPGDTTMVDTFVDYLSLHPRGVKLSMEVDSMEVDMCARDARTLQTA